MGLKKLLFRPTTRKSNTPVPEFMTYASMLIAFAAFGFYTSTAGQKPWQDNLLRDGDS